ncbi:MAG: exopolysaccharide biosynthesis protein [Proteobacteria bacterium]|nr:exopolysaccharide biosynthesis protein [Pseudomonadota bacterium]
MDKRITTTQILRNVVNGSKSDRISINDLMAAMDAGGFGLVMMIFSLPILIPLPPPLPSLISIPLIIFSFQMIIGFTFPHLPKSLSNFSVKREVLAKMAEKSNQYLMRFEKLLKRRLTFLSKGWSERLIGLCIFIFSLSILVPLPFTNLLPGVGILIISFGLLGHDGLVIIVGLFVGAMGLIVTTITVYAGVGAVMVIKDFIVNALSF